MGTFGGGQSVSNKISVNPGLNLPNTYTAPAGCYAVVQLYGDTTTTFSVDGAVCGPHAANTVIGPFWIGPGQSIHSGVISGGVVSGNFRTFGVEFKNG